MQAEMVSKGYTPTVDTYAGRVVRCEADGLAYSITVESVTGGPWAFVGVPGPCAMGAAATVSVTTTSEGKVQATVLVHP